MFASFLITHVSNHVPEAKAPQPLLFAKSGVLRFPLLRSINQSHSRPTASPLNDIGSHQAKLRHCSSNAAVLVICWILLPRGFSSPPTSESRSNASLLLRDSRSFAELDALSMRVNSSLVRPSLKEGGKALPSSSSSYQYGDRGPQLIGTDELTPMTGACL